MHPTIAAHAVLAAQIVGLDVAGLDIVVEDISQPLESQGGVVVEVNAGPGLLMHLRPTEGNSAAGGRGHRRQPLSRRAEWADPDRLRHRNKRQDHGDAAGVANAAGDGPRRGKASHRRNRRRRQDDRSGDCAGPAARKVLLNPHVEAGVFEAARGGILREGLGFDRCDVAVVTNIGEGDHLGRSYIDTLEQMLIVKRSAVDVIFPTGTVVLKADDPLVAEMAAVMRRQPHAISPATAHSGDRRPPAAGKRARICPPTGRSSWRKERSRRRWLPWTKFP